MNVISHSALCPCVAFASERIMYRKWKLFRNNNGSINNKTWHDLCIATFATPKKICKRRCSAPRLIWPLYFRIIHFKRFFLCDTQSVIRKICCVITFKGNRVQHSKNILIYIVWNGSAWSGIVRVSRQERRNGITLPIYSELN